MAYWAEVGEKWARRDIELVALSLEPAVLREACASVRSGLAAVCALLDGSPVGIAVTAFAVVSAEPALASVCVPRGSGAWTRLRNLPRLGVSVLPASQEPASRALSLPCGDRFSGVQ